MKKVLFMLLCAASVALVGCNGNEPEDQPTPKSDSITVTGSALAKLAFDKTTGTDALSMMKLSTEYRFTYSYGNSTDSTYQYGPYNSEYNVDKYIKITVRQADNVVTKTEYVYRTNTNTISTVGADMVKDNFGESIKLRDENLPFMGDQQSWIGVSYVGTIYPKTCQEAVDTLRNCAVYSSNLYWEKNSLKATANERWDSGLNDCTITATYEIAEAE